MSDEPKEPEPHFPAPLPRGARLITEEPPKPADTAPPPTPKVDVPAVAAAEPAAIEPAPAPPAPVVEAAPVAEPTAAAEPVASPTAAAAPATGASPSAAAPEVASPPTVEAAEAATHGGPPIADAEAAATKPAKPTSAALVPGRLAEVFAIASGILYFLAFAGFDLWPLTFVCIAPLYLALFGQTTKRATWLGFLTGLAMNLGGFYWLVNMLKTFSGFPLPLCILFTVIVCAYQGGRLALLGWLHGRATNRGWPAAPVFTLAFAASELVYPLLFPWYYAATVHNVPVLMQTADLAGPILVGLVLVGVNLAIAEPIRALLAKRRGARPEVVAAGPASEALVSIKIDRRVIGAGAIALAVAILYGAIRIPMTNSRVAKAESAKVGYVQANMGLMEKRQNFGEGMRRHRSLTNELRDKGADLVVWSETSATAPAEESEAMKTPYFRDRFAASLKVPTIFGAVLYRVEPNGDRWLYNSAIATDVKGNVRGRYDKQYLLAFGEYLPFGQQLPILYKWSPHSGRFTPGTSLEPVIAEVKGAEHKVSVLICYEDILPGFTNRAVSYAKPELLVNMTNDAWFGDTLEPWQHLALAKFRAVEHRRYLVRSTNSGVSAIIDPNGKIVEGSLSSTFKTEAHDGVVHWLQGATVYEWIGDGIWYVVSLASVVLAFRRRRPKPAPAAVATAA